VVWKRTFSRTWSPASTRSITSGFGSQGGGGVVQQFQKLAASPPLPGRQVAELVTQVRERELVLHRLAADERPERPDMRAGLRRGRRGHILRQGEGADWRRLARGVRTAREEGCPESGEETLKEVASSFHVAAPRWPAIMDGRGDLAMARLYLFMDSPARFSVSREGGSPSRRVDPVALVVYPAGLLGRGLPGPRRVGRACAARRRRRTPGPQDLRAAGSTYPEGNRIRGLRATRLPS